jgi:hypothetical protein
MDAGLGDLCPGSHLLSGDCRRVALFEGLTILTSLGLAYIYLTYTFSDLVLGWKAALEDIRFARPFHSSLPLLRTCDESLLWQLTGYASYSRQLL